MRPISKAIRQPGHGSRSAGATTWRQWRGRLLAGAAVIVGAAASAGCSGAVDDGAAKPAAAVAPAQASIAARSGPAATAAAASPSTATAHRARVADPYASALVNPRTQREGASAYLNGVNLFFDTKEGIRDAVTAYAAANPRLEVIRGYGWNLDSFGGAPPSTLELDGAVRDRPVILLSADLRSAWRNSRATGLPIAHAPNRS